MHVCIAGVETQELFYLVISQATEERIRDSLILNSSVSGVGEELLPWKQGKALNADQLLALLSLQKSLYTLNEKIFALLTYQ